MDNGWPKHNTVLWQSYRDGIFLHSLSLSSMPCRLWQYLLWIFKLGDTKLNKYLTENEQILRENSIFWNERNFVFQQQILHFLSKHFKTEITSSFIINRKYLVNMIVQINYLWTNIANECKLNFCWFGIIPFPKICIQIPFEYVQIYLILQPQIWKSTTDIAILQVEKVAKL